MYFYVGANTAYSFFFTEVLVRKPPGATLLIQLSTAHTYAPERLW